MSDVQAEASYSVEAPDCGRPVLHISTPLGPFPRDQHHEDTRDSSDNCGLPAVVNRHCHLTPVVTYEHWTGREVRAA